MMRAPIVVGLDQSISAPSVLENALALCRLLDRPLVTVTTVDLPPDATSTFELALELDWRKKIDDELDRMTSNARRGTVVGRQVAIASPARTLMETATEWQSPLIVVGSHSRQTSDLVLGTTAARVVNRAECSVFVCRPWRQIHASFARVVVGLDGSERAGAVLGAAMRLVQSPGARLTLLRSTESPVALAPLLMRQQAADLERLLVDDAKRYLGALQKEIGEDVNTDIQTPVDTPWRALCDSAEQDNCDAIVIGAHGYSMLDRVLGTTAARVVNHANRSVLVVKGQTLSEF